MATLLEHVNNGVQLAKNIAAAAKVISEAAPAMKSTIEDVTRMAAMMRQVGSNATTMITHPPEVIHAAGVLGLALPVEESAIKDAYRKAAVLAHPDRNGGNDAAMVRVNLAQKTLLEYFRKPKR
jgi:hypothetical protein